MKRNKKYPKFDSVRTKDWLDKVHELEANGQWGDSKAFKKLYAKHQKFLRLRAK